MPAVRGGGGCEKEVMRRIREEWERNGRRERREKKGEICKYLRVIYSVS